MDRCLACPADRISTTEAKPLHDIPMALDVYGSLRSSKNDYGDYGYVREKRSWMFLVWVNDDISLT